MGRGAWQNHKESDMTERLTCTFHYTDGAQFNHPLIVGHVNCSQFSVITNKVARNHPCTVSIV